MALAGYEKKLNKDQKAAAKALGINKVNKLEELTRINNYIAAAERAQSDPVYQQVAKNMGITNFNSINDYAQIVNRMAAQSAPAQPAPSPAPSQPMYNYTDPGDKGYFGMKDFEELQRQGAPMSVIREYAAKAPYGVGPAVAEMFRKADQPKTQYTNQIAQTQSAINNQQQQSAPSAPQLDVAKLIQDLQISSQNQIQQMQQEFQAQQAAAESARQAELQRMQEAQRTYQINQARSNAASGLKIEGAGGGQGIGGTDVFKIRPQRGMLFGGGAIIKPATTLNI